LKRKLMLLNVVLLVLAVLAGWRLRQEWLDAKAREAATLALRIKPAPPPPFTPLANAGPVVPSGYAPIVQNLLFDRSRNPNVVVELPPAPPPEPVPPLPAYYGTMNLGDGPLVVLGLPPAGQQAVELGGTIGQFKLVSVNTDEIAFEWKGQTIRKKLHDLAEAAAAPQAAAPVRTDVPAPAAAAAPPVPQQPLGPGQQLNGGYKACLPNDNMPAGAVVDGYRKILIPTPFGVQSCRWDPVNR
jgi:hypothetical protein